MCPLGAFLGSFLLLRGPPITQRSEARLSNYCAVRNCEVSQYPVFCCCVQGNPRVSIMGADPPIAEPLLTQNHVMAQCLSLTLTQERQNENL